MRTLLAGALAAIAVLLLPAAAAAGGRWTDPTGDSGTAPDVTTIDVSNDSAGNVTFSVGLVSHPALASDEGIGVYIDSDQNASTGIAYRYRPGIDQLVFLNAGNTWDVYGASGGNMTPVDRGSASVTYTPTGFTVRINKAQLGGTSAFRFWVQTQKASASGSLAASDLAPDAGQAGYAYTLTTLTRATVKLQPATAAKKGVRPGTRLAVSADAGLSDGTTAVPDSVTCTATIGTKALPGTCAWKVPKTAAGKSIAVAVTVAYGGQSQTVRVAVRVLRK